MAMIGRLCGVWIEFIRGDRSGPFDLDPTAEIAWAAFFSGKRRAGAVDGGGLTRTSVAARPTEGRRQGSRGIG